jgi:hypothetical protein
MDKLKEPKLTSELKIIDLESEKIIFEDTLYTNLNFPIPDAMIGKDRFIYYVKNQKELIAIKIPLEL